MIADWQETFSRLYADAMVRMLQLTSILNIRLSIIKIGGIVVVARQSHLLLEVETSWWIMEWKGLWKTNSPKIYKIEMIKAWAIKSPSCWH